MLRVYETGRGTVCSSTDGVQWRVLMRSPRHRHRSPRKYYYRDLFEPRDRRENDNVRLSTKTIPFAIVRLARNEFAIASFARNVPTRPYDRAVG